MEVTLCQINWDNILELTKIAENKGDDPVLWAIQLSSNLNSAGVSLPSPQLATLLVSHICWDNNVPIAWKFLEKALIFNIVPPILVLALLSKRYKSFFFSFSCICFICICFFFCILCNCTGLLFSYLFVVYCCYCLIQMQDMVFFGY